MFETICPSCSCTSFEVMPLNVRNATGILAVQCVNCHRPIGTVQELNYIKEAIRKIGSKIQADVHL